MNVSGIIRDNFKTIGLLIGGYIAAAEYGYIEYPELSAPNGWGLLVTAAIIVYAAAHYYGDSILDLLPDEEGIYIIAFKSHDEAGGEVWELTEDQFSDMRVVNGTLFQWTKTGKRVYECREYDSERNVAVANWRESVAGSQFAGDAKVADAMDFILEIREEFEPDSERLNRLQRRIRGVARRLDRQRLEDQQQVLDPHYAPAFGDDEATVGDVLQDVVGDNLLPESMTADDDERLTEEHANGNGDGDGEFAGFELLEDADALEPEVNDD